MLAGVYDIVSNPSLNVVSRDLCRFEKTPYPFESSNSEIIRHFHNNNENEFANNEASYEILDDLKDKEEDDEFESICEADKIKLKPCITKDNKICISSEDISNARSLQTFKSMVGVNNNCFALNKEKVDQKNPAKVINPHGCALQISTSDIQTIKSIMKYAAENGQEVTIIIPMRKTKTVTACPHYDRKHYAKNMCSACYNKNGRTKKAWACGHPDKIHYAKGLCQFCYLAKYHKENSSSK